MKNKLYISLLAASALGISACHSDIDNFMVDDTVGFLNGGLYESEVYTGVDDPTKVFVIKAGKGFQSATATISVDPSILTEYNALSSTKVQIGELPTDCYTITVSSVELTNEDYRMPFEISWNRDRLEAVLAANPNLGVPLHLSVNTTGNIAENRMTTIVKPILSVPYIGFTKAGVSKISPTRADATEKEFYFEVSSNFIAQRDIDYTIEVNPLLVDEYNQAHNSNYIMLPEDAYSIDLDGTIKQHLNKSYVKMVFNRTALVPDNAPSNFGNFMLPIRLKSLSSSNIDTEKSVIYYTVSVEATKLAKNKWSIVECNSDLNDDPEATDKEKEENSPNALLDGSTTTWWRSYYRAPQDLPYYIVIDFGRKTAVAKVGFEIPSGTNKRNANSKAGHVEFSLDGVNWINAGTWVSTSTSASPVEFAVTPMTARYMKFVIEEAFKSLSLAGVNNPNATGISEINAWGEVATWEEE